MSSLHVFHAFLPADSSSESPNLIPSKDKNGCWICRFRKKTCKTYDENGPDYDASDKRCFDCKKFNILCCGQSADRPSGQGICKTVRDKTREWISNKMNRRTCVPPLDLSYLWPSEIGASPSGNSPSNDSPPSTPAESPFTDFSDLLPAGLDVIQSLFPTMSSSSSQLVLDVAHAHLEPHLPTSEQSGSQMIDVNYPLFGEQNNSDFSISNLEADLWLQQMVSHELGTASSSFTQPPAPVPCHTQGCTQCGMASDPGSSYDFHTDLGVVWSQQSYVPQESAVPDLISTAGSPGSSSEIDAPTPSTDSLHSADPTCIYSQQFSAPSEEAVPEFSLAGGYPSSLSKMSSEIDIPIPPTDVAQSWLIDPYLQQFSVFPEEVVPDLFPPTGPSEFAPRDTLQDRLSNLFYEFLPISP